MQAIPAQAIPAFQCSTQCNVPVLPTFESQTDTGITNPIVCCHVCHIRWRSHRITLCPNCARMTGQRLFLEVRQMWELMDVISLLNEHATFNAETKSEMDVFRNLLFDNTMWYNSNCRMTIQACYESLSFRPTNKKIAYAMAFFEEEYFEAPENEKMYNPDEEEEFNYAADLINKLELPLW